MLLCTVHRPFLRNREELQLAHDASGTALTCGARGEETSGEHRAGDVNSNVWTKEMYDNVERFVAGGGNGWRGEAAMRPRRRTRRVRR
jgi:hypothetical protein